MKSYLFMSVGPSLKDEAKNSIVYNDMTDSKLLLLENVFHYYY